MSSQDVQKIKAHFMTSKEFNDKQSPSASELWFVKLPHWLNYSDGGCLGITTQPTASGNEINFYSGACFVVHCGKYADGTLKNQVLYINEDKYLTVSASGSYCFDESGNMVTGTITYNEATNQVSVNGVVGNYTKPVQDFTYSGGVVTLGDPIEISSIGGGGSAELVQSGNNWGLKFGNYVFQCCQGYLEYGEYSTDVYLPVPMKDTSYSASLISGSYYYPYVDSKNTAYVTVAVSDAWDTVNFVLFVAGEC